jgi:hypothetical protein
MFERKNKTIKLFDREFILSERNASDVLVLANFSEKNQSNDLNTLIYKALEVCDASLSYNYINLPWYKYFEKRKLKKILSKKHLFKTLSQQQIFSMASDVFELEGLIASDSSEKKTQTI